MTLDYINNSCALSVNTAWGNTDLQGYRKGMYVELFAMFLFYFISQCLLAFRYRPIPTTMQSQQQSLRSSANNESRASTTSEQRESIKPPTLESSQNRQSMLQKPQKKQENKEESSERPIVPWNDRKWSRSFPYLFSFHAVGMGMCILFSPLAGALVICYFHLLFFGLFVIVQLFLKSFIGKIIRIILDLLNLSLILIGTVGINYATTNSSGICLINVTS